MFNTIKNCGQWALDKANQAMQSTKVYVPALALGLLSIFGGSYAQAQTAAEASLAEAVGVINQRAEEVQDLAITAATSLSTNAVIIATAALVLLVVLMVINYIWGFSGRKKTVS